MGYCLGHFSQDHSLFVAFFLAGVTAGFTHCIAMCGPFAACHSLCGSARCTNIMQIRRALALPYHLGRICCYGALGFAAALLAKQIVATSYWPLISAIILSLAGVIFLISSMKACRHRFFRLPGKLTYMHGVLLGFLPCGALYAALMIAATLANPLSAMLAMMFFVLGTMPALFIATIGTHLISQTWQSVMQRVGSAVMAFNGLSLLVMAINIVR